MSSETTEKISKIVHTDLKLQEVHFLISTGLYGPLYKVDKMTKMGFFAWLEQSLFDIRVGTPLSGPQIYNSNQANKSF